MNKKELSVLLGLVVAFLFSLCSENIQQAETVKANTLRLHVIANSDATADQDIKMTVKEEILQMENLLSVGSNDFYSALKNVKENLPIIEEKINNSLSAQNAGYSAKCSIEKFYFDTTSYTGFALPQGEYTALTVRLGNAQGKNWWCVLYPALCSQSCGEIVLENSDEFIKTDKITPRFKVVELYEDVKAYFVQRTDKYQNLS